MATRIRLQRRGRKKRPVYDIVVADQKAPRDGRIIEKLGSYNPNTSPKYIKLDGDKAFDWVMKGAQPSDTARKLLSIEGVMFRKHLQVGVNKGAKTQEAADKEFESWKAKKTSSDEAAIGKIAADKAAAKKARIDAENAKVAEAVKAEEEAKAAALAEAAAAAKAEEEAKAAEAAAEEAPAEEAATEEAPAAEAKEEEAKDAE